MQNNSYDKELKILFEKDGNDLSPDPGIQERLNYAFMLNSSQYKTRQNSFVGFAAWIFSWSNLPLKAAMVAMVLFVSLFNFQNSDNGFLLPLQDTTMNFSPAHIDSSEMLPFFADTCFLSKIQEKKQHSKSASSPENLHLISLTENLNAVSNADNNFPVFAAIPFVSDRFAVRPPKPIHLNSKVVAEYRFVV